MVGDCCEILLSGHDRTIAPMNSQWLDCLYKTFTGSSQAKILAWAGEEAMTSIQLSSYWQSVATGEARVSFLQGCGPLEATHAPVADPIPMHILVALSR